MSEEAPAVVAEIQERWETVPLMGGELTALIVRGEDLRELRKWATIPDDSPRVEFHGVPVVGLEPKEVFAVGKVMVVRSEDLERLQAANEQREGKPFEFAALDPGDCWALASKGEGIPRSD